MVMSCYFSFSLCREVMMIMYSHSRTFTPFMSASIIYSFFYFSYVLGVIRRIF
jgi:hypothetical protein